MSFRIPNALRWNRPFIWRTVPVTAFKLVNFACAIHLFTEYVGRVSFMAGPSMLPTLATEGELVIEDMLSVRLSLRKIARGDLITLTSPLDPDRVICKRVLGLPGDVICVDPTGQKAPSDEHVIIPNHHIWIIGDNASFSRDSRDYGPVPVRLVRGRLFARIYPRSRMEIFRNPMNYID